MMFDVRPMSEAGYGLAICDDVRPMDAYGNFAGGGSGC